MKIILFGSRIDDSKRGGDFDIAIISNLNSEDFKKAKIKFKKELILNDIDLPLDIINYNLTNELLKKEIDKKGVELFIDN